MAIIPYDGLKSYEPRKANKIRNIIGAVLFIPLGIIML